MTPEKARQDLKVALAKKGADLAAASRAIGRSHAYLQQFVKRGKPLYLHERDREKLVTLYGIDPEPLKPPALAVDRESPARDTSRPPRPGDPIKDAREATLIHTWRQISKEDQDIVSRLLIGLSRAPPIAI